MMGLKRIVGLEYEVLGKENILSPPALYVCNHQSSWETFAACVLIPNVSIVTKLELMRLPIFGWYLRHSPMIAVDRTAGASAVRNMVRQAKEAMAMGRSVLIYAEGTRCGVHEHRSFKSGVVALYRSLNVPAAPTAVNSGIFWKQDTSLKYAGKISISFLSPIHQGVDRPEFKQTIQQLIHDEKDALVQNCYKENSSI
jgi:1-acyl-sn-glycerol-3-phosphate acyltransferase